MQRCDHCGLPITGAGVCGAGDGATARYCCYGCRMVDEVLGAEDEATAGPLSPQRLLLYRFVVGALLAGFVMVLSLAISSEYGFGALQQLDHTIGTGHWVLLAVAVPTLVLLGWPVVRSAAADLRGGRLTLNVLFTLGAGSAVAVSLASYVRGTGPVYLETATMLLALYTLGRYLDARAKGQTTRVLSRLLAVPTATYERLHPDPGPVPGETLRVGDRVRLRTGDVLPVDGTIVAGRSFVDEHSLTGEHQPVTRERGDPVYAGTALEDGTLTVEVTATGEERRLARIEQMMRTAMQRPTRLATTTDRIMRWLIPGVIVLALGTFGVWFAIAGFEKALYAALSVVLITCPCALGLAIPLTLVVALGESARRGVLVRSGQTLLDLDQAQTVAFDKTGTLSRVGMASVAVVVPEAVPETVPAGTPPTPDDVLRLAASLEAGVRHPLAQAVLDEADRRALDLLSVETVRTEAGAGIIGTVRDGTTRHHVALGNASLAEQMAGSLPPAFAKRATQLEAAGATVLYAIVDRMPTALLALYEQIPDAALDALHALRDDGLNVEILTGGRSAAAARLQRRLDVPVRSGLSPSDKLDHLRRLRERGPVVMVGDGVNDAAALAEADVGIGLASGADITLEAAGVTLYNPDLRNVVWLRRLAHRTRRVIRQNLGWTFGYNAIGLGLAVFGLLHPLVAVAVMVVSSALVTGNALRLRRMPGVRDEVA